MINKYLTRPVVIAVDGPAASGKSSISSRISSKLGYLYVNSGAMYRALTWSVLRSGLDPHNAVSVIEHLSVIDMDCGQSLGLATLKVNGVDPGVEMKSAEVNDAVSVVSAIPEVREVLVAKQRDYREVSNIVMEGRDIGSVVFPETPYKIYIDASEEVRAKRRMIEGIHDDLIKRDTIDSARKASPLIISDEAFVIDTSQMSLDEVVNEVLRELQERGLEVIY